VNVFLSIAEAKEEEKIRREVSTRLLEIFDLALTTLRAGCIPTEERPEVPVTWNDVVEGDIVYIDNYQDGKNKKARPKKSGPYTVVSPTRRTLLARYTDPIMGKPGKIYEREITNMPDNLILVKAFSAKAKLSDEEEKNETDC
jgi:hypothetical protein